jgi:peptidoglycan DL-endopeptidase CwlO
LVKGKRGLIVLCLALLALLLALPSSSSAETLAQKKARAHQILQQLSVLDKKLEVAVERYDAASQQLQDTRDRIRQNQRNLKIAQYNLSVAKATLEQRVVALYKQRPVDLLDVMLATKSFDDFMTQIDLMNRLGQSDSTVVDSVSGYKQSVVAVQSKLAADQKTALKLVAQRGAEKQSVEAQLATRRSMYAGVKRQIDQLLAAQRAAQTRAAQSAGVITTGGTPPAGITGAAAYAYNFLGCPYQYGAAGPDRFDCSGFTMYVYSHFGVGLPHNAAMQQSMVTAVTADQLQPGDLVFFGIPAYHVGIYVGGGMMIHAPHTGTVVSVSSIAGASSYGRP